MTFEIPLTRGMVSIVDEADFAEMSRIRWTACPSRSTFYAHRTIYSPHKQTISMHSVLTGWPLVDRIDGNGLNNQRANLRQATRVENSRNRPGKPGSSSQYKGVSLHLRGKWLARIAPAPGRQKHIGVYSSEAEAALAYDSIARDLFGEFAYLNFPTKGIQS